MKLRFNIINKILQNKKCLSTFNQNRINHGENSDLDVKNAAPVIDSSLILQRRSKQHCVNADYCHIK